MEQWWLFSDTDAQMLRDDLERMAVNLGQLVPKISANEAFSLGMLMGKIIYIFEAGLHTTDAVPADYEATEDEEPDEVEDRLDDESDDDEPIGEDDSVIDEPNFETDKAQAALWAQSILEKPFVIFDTETTGLGDFDEIIQIGIIDQDGNTVFESLIKPTQSIGNSHIHGITDEMVKDAPTLADVYDQVKAALSDKTVVIYNSDFDLKMLSQSFGKHKIPLFHIASTCAMTKYAQFAGEWNDYYGNYRWQKLADAVAAFGKQMVDFGTKAHDACTDTRATLAVIRGMAEWKPEESPTVSDEDKF